MEREEMKATDAIRAILEESGITQTAFAEMLGYRHQSGISGRLNTLRTSVDKLGEMADVLGYEIVLRKKIGKGTEYVLTDGMKK